MVTLYTLNNKLVKAGSKFYGVIAEPEPPEPAVYDVILTTDGHGTITANPMSGVKDTLITLSNTPAQNYVFSKYTLNNVDLAGNTFLMPEADANVKGWFEADMRTITVTQPSHGTITAPASAQIGSTVTLSCTPESGYALQYFTVNGSQIQGSSFVMPASNVTVSASLVSTAPVFDQVTIGNQTWMAKNLAIDDGGEGIYTRTINYGQGDVVEHYYTWDAASRIAASITGWHFPTDDEWNTLASTIGGASVAGNKLKSTYGWDYDYDHDRSGGGTDEYGFGAFPAGYYVNANGGYYSQLGDGAKFWTANNFSTTEGRGKGMYCTSYSMSYDYYQKLDALTVRLIKDS